MTDATDEDAGAEHERPSGTEVDNSGVRLPTVEKFAEMTAGEDVDGSAGRADPSAAFRDLEVSDEERAEIEEERERRLAPENRPPGAEVDNTQRTMKDGKFID
ncbi:MAG: hypothetical protein WB767_01005 [Nocardioides sp.]